MSVVFGVYHTFGSLQERTGLKMQHYFADDVGFGIQVSIQMELFIELSSSAQII